VPARRWRRAASDRAAGLRRRLVDRDCGAGAGARPRPGGLGGAGPAPRGHADDAPGRHRRRAGDAGAARPVPDLERRAAARRAWRARTGAARSRQPVRPGGRAAALQSAGERGKGGSAARAPSRYAPNCCRPSTSCWSGAGRSAAGRRCTPRCTSTPSGAATIWPA
jgi:hypothetical protein